MKVFISWSGDRSLAVAHALREWVSSVIQAAKPFLSAQDIERGAQWASDIGTQLQESTVGIFCLTKSNKAAPWILFEAGAVAKGVAGNRICTLLIDLEPYDVLGPLAQFNHTKPDFNGMLKLATTLNLALGDARLTEAHLKKSFEAHWPAFEKDFEEALLKFGDVSLPEAVPDTQQMLSEILTSIRGISGRLVTLEQTLPEQYESSLRGALTRTNALHELASRVDSQPVSPRRTLNSDAIRAVLNRESARNKNVDS